MLPVRMKRRRGRRRKKSGERRKRVRRDAGCGMRDA
jgi:hypothetical protein